MGFLKNFFTNVFEADATGIDPSCFDQLSENQLEDHLDVARYGNFLLTDAVRPSFDLKVVPSQGYRYDAYRDADSDTQVPVVMASTSKEIVFELFMEMIEPLGEVVDVVLETSHQQQGQEHSDLYREHIDMPVLKSTLWDYEDLLTNDGCTGIAVLNPGIPQEVQFDEHKLVIMYGKPLDSFESVLKSYSVHCQNEMKFITESEHVHSSNDDYCERFEELKMRLGMDAHFD